ncbi:hypothetical protein U9M48_043229 [Paspalum notatum var. saurae]|uniref:Uncharacterized protein n=1 Tax=Paspalum notatum var. saurae TaxID=547442 RepID=A0AAQ3UWV2_PASNO
MAPQAATPPWRLPAPALPPSMAPLLHPLHGVQQQQSPSSLYSCATACPLDVHQVFEDIDFERNCKPGCPLRSPTVRSYPAKVKASLLVQFRLFRCHEHNLTHAGCRGVGHYNEDRYHILNQGPEGGAVLHGTNSFWHQTSPSSDPR